MDKRVMYEAGLVLMQRFCERNDIAMPSVVVVPRSQWRFPSTCAYYRPTKITICLEACASIGYGGRAWSYPGYTIDRTPYGVIQHELGHHIDYLHSGEKGEYGGDFSESLRRLTKEPKLTGYCPNDWEWFAEIFRLFVTNPSLLKATHPLTYARLREKFTPAVDKSWRAVLKHAPQRTLEMAARKAA